jgi:hypothetical protein
VQQRQKQREKTQISPGKTKARFIQLPHATDENKGKKQRRKENLFIVLFVLRKNHSSSAVLQEKTLDGLIAAYSALTRHKVCNL